MNYFLLFVGVQPQTDSAFQFAMFQHLGIAMMIIGLLAMLHVLAKGRRLERR